MMKAWSPFTLHDGTAQPLADDVAVLIIRRRMIGDQPDYANGLAGEFDWSWSSNGDPGDDVVAYQAQ